MKTTNNVAINGEALRAAIYNKGMNTHEASLKLGFSQKYILGCIKREYLPKSSMLLIENVLGIKPKKYVVECGKAEEPKNAEKKPTVIDDGKMIRNINVEFIRFRAHEIGLPLKSLCDVMCKKGNYLGNLRNNGAKKEEIARIAMILRIDENDERLYVKPTPLKDAPPETTEKMKSDIRKLESKIAQQNTQINELKVQLSELRSRMTGAEKLSGAIIGTLFKHNIHVGKK